MEIPKEAQSYIKESEIEDKASQKLIEINRTLKI
jgi:hypothetical protein